MTPVVANGNCTVEQAAYAAAVASYTVAEQAVEDAYNDWVDCEGGGEERPDDFADDSILVK